MLGLLASLKAKVWTKLVALFYVLSASLDVQVAILENPITFNKMGIIMIYERY